MTKFRKRILERVELGVLVVSGSRGLIGYHGFAQYACQLATDRGWSIAIGDARGVDTAVIRMAAKMKVPLVILGCKAVDELRLTPPDGALTQLIEGGDKSGSCFVVRDIALASLAATTEHNGFIGFWNGSSRGTQQTAKACRNKGIPGMMMLPNKTIAQRWERGSEKTEKQKTPEALTI